MKRLCAVKEALIDMVYSKIGDLECIDAEEMGEVIDMIKDIEEAKYYCAITKAMEDGKDVTTIAIDTATRGTGAHLRHDDSTLA